MFTGLLGDRMFLATDQMVHHHCPMVLTLYHTHTQTEWMGCVRGWTWGQRCFLVPELFMLS